MTAFDTFKPRLWNHHACSPRVLRRHTVSLRRLRSLSFTSAARAMAASRYDVLPPMGVRDAGDGMRCVSFSPLARTTCVASRPFIIYTSLT